jgi:indoleamine 2,3-dioxygenase
MSTFIAAPELSYERGFLPPHDPLTRLPEPFDAWETVALGLPKHLVSDRIRRTIEVEDLPLFPVEAIANDRERERAMALLSYLGHAYVWSGERPAEILPKRLAVPWHAIAESLGRPPVLSYSSYALHNFFRFQQNRDVECGNIGLIQNFLGGIDEEWFILIHIEIERRAASGVAALHSCLDATDERDADRLEALLRETLNGAAVGDLFMSLIHDCELNSVNPLDYLTKLLRHAEALKQQPSEWMPWNYRETLARSTTPTAA